MSKFYSPLRYPGGKNCIFPFMSELIHENGLDGCVYAEPFAGGAGLALHLLLDGIVSEVYLNDLDRSIYCFWNSIIERTDDFCNWIKEVSVTMETWNWAKGIYSNLLTEDPFELAKATFFLNRTNVSGIITGGPIGGPNQIGKFKINARFNKTDLINRIRRIGDIGHAIHLYCLDGTEFLKMLNRKHKPMFIYIDPPYVTKGSDLYMNFFNKDDHRELMNRIIKIRKHWLISYDNTEFIRELYPNFTKYIYSLSQCTSNRVGDELIILDTTLCADKAIRKLKNPIRID